VAFKFLLSMFVSSTHHWMGDVMILM